MADAMADVQQPRTGDTCLPCIIYYHDPTALSGTVKFFGGKEKIRIPLEKSFSSCKETIMKYANIKCEAASRGLGNSVELKLYRLDKSGGGTQAFAIPTGEAWDLEYSKLAAGDMLQINVLKKYTFFDTNSPTISIVEKDSTDETLPLAKKRKPGSGRKSSQVIIQDRALVQDIKQGKEIVRNERQMKLFGHMEEEFFKLSNTVALNETAAKCGNCHTVKTIAEDRKPEGKLKYFREKHYSACLRKTEKVEKSGFDQVQKTKMAKLMSSWCTHTNQSNKPKPQDNERMDSSDDADSDRDMDIDQIDANQDMDENVDV